MGNKSEDELNFLDELDRETSDAVRVLINSDLKDEDKSSALRVLLSPDHFQLFQAYNAIQTPRKKLLKLLSRELREQCSHFIETSNMKALRIVLNSSSPQVIKALDELEKSLVEVSPDEKFLRLVPSGKQDMCRSLLESKNFSAIKTILPDSNRSVLSALDDLERAWSEAERQGISPKSIRSTTEQSAQRNHHHERGSFGHDRTRNSRNRSSFYTNRTRRRGTTDNLRATKETIRNCYEDSDEDDISCRSGSTYRDSSSRAYSYADDGSCRSESTYRSSSNWAPNKSCGRTKDSLASDSRTTDQYLRKNKKLDKCVEDRYQARIGVDNNGSDFEVKISAKNEESLTQAFKFFVDCRGGRAAISEESERGQVGRIRSEGLARHHDDHTLEEESYADNSHCEYEDLSSYPDTTNILFLGETGVGKSTAINSLVNYLQFRTLDEAMNDFTVLIRAKFTITESDGKSMASKEVETPPTVSACEFDENEVVAVGESATQYPKCYDFIWNVNGLRKTIRIIDTPGIGDVRGITKDKENFNNILKFIADFPEIHAICILIQPDAKKLTPAFRFCIDELLAHLHRTASRNLIFCFPSTRSTFYKPGETYTILQKHLGNLKHTRNIDIPLNSSTLFSFDNEAFKYLCGAKQGIRYSESQIKQFRESYAYSYKETRRLFAQIIKIPPHKVCETLCINNTRSLILALAAPLAECLRNQTLNITLLKEKIAELARLQEDGADLKGKLYVQQEVINPKEIDYPRTVCASQGCVEFKSFSGNSNHVQTVYKTVCHSHCYLTGIQPESYPDVGLRNCAAMKGEHCKYCQCSWQTHLHIRYELETTIVSVTDPAVERELDNKNDDFVATLHFVEAMKKKMNALKRDSEKIMKYSAKFADFLNSNSIIPYNDSYLQYIEYLITQEQAKSAISKNDTMVKELEKHKAEYQAQVQILKSAKGNGESAASIEEINRMIDELKSISTGEVLQKMKNLELLTIRQTQHHQSVSVMMKTYSFGNLLMGSQSSPGTRHSSPYGVLI